MGTRCLTVVVDAGHPETDICVIYRHADGYLSGHGAELKEFLKDMRVVNGIPFGEPTLNMANGAGCLAAQIVAHFKKDVGEFYLYGSGARNVGESYIYTIYVTCNAPLRIRVTDGTVVYDGPLAEMPIEDKGE